MLFRSLTIKGGSDKTFNWVDSTDSWTSSENLNLLTGKAFKIAGTDVLSGSSLGSGVTGSSLTSVGTLSSLSVSGTTSVANVSYTGTLTGGTGIVNIGSGQIYKDASGNVGIGTNAPGYKLDVAGSANVGILTASSLSTIGNATLGSGSSNTVTFNAGTVTLNNSTVISAASTKTLTLNGGAGSNGLVLDASNNVGIEIGRAHV